MGDDLSKIRQKISQLGKKREILETKIMNTGSLVKASYYERFIVCGKPNCKCTRGEKHGPVPWVTGGKGRKVISTSVPAENVTKVKEMAQNYKDFRNAQKEIEKISREINELILKILQMKECDISEVLKRKVDAEEFTWKEGEKRGRKQKKSDKGLEGEEN